MRLINWINGLLQDEKGIPSSKRLVGIVCAIYLCTTMYAEKSPPEYIVNAVALLAFGGLGLTALEKIFANRNSTK